MLAHTKARRTKVPNSCKITIETSFNKKSYCIPNDCVEELENFLREHSKINEPIEWEILAKERIEKHKKVGLVLRGIRYRENISQRELARRSGISQNEISKIENGKRVVGMKVAKRLAESLGINHNLLTEA